MCGVGYLKRWAADNPNHRRLTVPPGWYTVEVQGRLLDHGADDAAFEFVLTPTVNPQPFSADLEQDFDLIDPR